MNDNAIKNEEATDSALRLSYFSDRPLLSQPTHAILFFILVFITPTPVLAERQKTLLPFAGIGYTKSGSPWGDGSGSHVGVRYLLSANSKQSYGLEISHLDLYALDNGGPDVRYTAVGVVIEQTLWSSFQVLL